MSKLDEPVLYVVHKEGRLLLRELGRSGWSRLRHYAFRSKPQAERIAKETEGAEVVVYRPEARRETQD